MSAKDFEKEMMELQNETEKTEFTKIEREIPEKKGLFGFMKPKPQTKITIQELAQAALNNTQAIIALQKEMESLQGNLTALRTALAPPEPVMSQEDAAICDKIMAELNGETGISIELIYKILLAAQKTLPPIPKNMKHSSATKEKKEKCIKCGAEIEQGNYYEIGKGKACLKHLSEKYKEWWKQKCLDCYKKNPYKKTGVLQNAKK